MNFFERQREVRRLSTRLVVLFIVAVIAIVLVVDLAAVLALSAWGWDAGALLGLVIATSLVTLAVIGLASLIRSALLRGGGGKVAISMGGVLVPPDTTDFQLRRLRNVVEEIAIASGVPVPEVYVLPEEQGINAFAAGWSPADAAVAVTRGALEQLNRDELQGVIAHEFSHILNGDMRLNIRLMGLLFGILVLAIVGRIALSAGRGRGKAAGVILLVGLAMLIAGYAGVVVGRMIKAAVSRQREYLADASAVQYTRQSSGIVGALKKIGGVPTGAKLGNARTEEVSHMLFGDGVGFSALYATHPPLPQRIKVLDPSFDPRELEWLAQQWKDAPPSGLAEDRARGLAPAAAPQVTPGGSVHVRPATVVAAVGAPTPAAYQWAESALASIPEQVSTRARRPDTAATLIFGLLLAAGQDARTPQHAALVARHGRPVADAAWQDANALASLDPALRLPIAELAFGALRHLPPAERQAFLGSVQALINADGRVSVAEYCLSRLLQRDLRDAAQPARRSRRHTLAGSRAAVAMLLATLAWVGHSDQSAAQRSLAAGLQQVLPDLPVPPGLGPPPQGLVALDAVWPALDGLHPTEKERLVASMVTVIGYDGVMTVSEIELLRTICAMLHCPLPPLTRETSP